MLGNPRVFKYDRAWNCCTSNMDFTKEQWYDVIEHTVPPKTVELNKQAFDVGYTL